MFANFEGHQIQSPTNARKSESFNTERDYNRAFSKKKVGEYSYYLNDIIGSGYSSHVYRCHHQSNPNITYAIKVIKLSRLAKPTLNLLHNEIKILQSLEHPNIIKFHNFYFTENNCYLVTDYCEGGTLQEHIDKGRKLDHEDIFQQLVSGCKYLEDRLVLHRDIKPANVFLKGKLWKIGDFGFARFLQNQQAIIRESYKVGSPLYMPPQTLKSCMYSLKTDSFALGILLFYSISRKFPWNGSNDKELLQTYEKNKFPSHYLSTVPFRMKRNIESLCSLDINERILIKQIEIDIKNPEAEQRKIKVTKLSSLETCIPEQSDSSIEGEDQNSQMLITERIKKKLDLDIIQRIKICKFIHYLNNNMSEFPSLEVLKAKLERLLKLFVVLFEWLQSDSYAKYLQELALAPSTKQYERIGQIHNLQDQICEAILCLSPEQENKKLAMIRLKLIQLRHILRLLLSCRMAKMKEFLNKCILHPDFAKIYIQATQIQEIEKVFSI